MSQPHLHRPMAESFGVDPDRYDRTRPAYPAELVARIVAALPGTDVLDVGSGTGIVARQFALAGCRVLGVEPDARMAAFARTSGVDVEVARFEDWDASGRSFDAVVAGTAWHWVDPVVGAAKAADILRPDGLLALFWNVSAPPPEVQDTLADAFVAAVPDAPFDLRRRNADAAGHQPILERWMDGMRTVGAFARPEQWTFAWQQEYSRDAWLDQLPTSGAMTMLDPERQAAVLDRVGDAVDALGGTITVSWTCLAVVARRLR